MGTEIQDFAALLRSLKERSGLSYGALAQKLHMSTSTIHRYCNGEAVPHDYAPVERFARVCRAPSDELVALHRQWILADEAKRRGARKAEAAGRFEPSMVTSELAAPPQEPVNRPDPAPGPGSEQGSEPGPQPETESEAEPGTVPGSAAAEDVTPDARSAGVVPAPGRLSGKRLRVLLAAVAVVALTVPTALAISHYSGDRSHEEGMDAPRSSAPVTPSRTGSTSPSPSPSKPSPSATSGSASPSATATKPTAPQGEGGKGGEGAKSTGSQGVPVTSTLSSYNWDWPCSQYFLLDRDPQGMPPVPDVADRARRNWSAQLGGVDGGKMLIELTLQGASQDAVVLKALRVRVVKQTAANDWPAYSMGEGCGGGIMPQSFNIDLDDGQPVSRPVAGEDAGKVVPAKNFPYRVSSTDVEVFHVNAHTEDHDVTWYLELDWSSKGRSGTLRIDDNGKPFRTAGMRNRPVYEYRSDTAVWEDISKSLEGQGG
ncbi:helix-turn-helix domain-containing protein [Streptomyces sp. NPDC050529]|uniref:helix-turn-helix domain-containing protein n=1 Tax=Streptomyces sp. NPDC050529 TaxID=3365624 RepID=UPI0037955539